MRARICILGVLVLAGILAVSGSVAGAAAPDAAGFWQRIDDPAGLLTANVPDGGLQVANDPTGPLAVAALRATVDGEFGEVRLRAISVQGNPNIVVCPAMSDWTPPEGAGAWDDRPEDGCATRALPVTIDPDDSDVFVFDASTMAVDGHLDVVLIPAAPAPFRVAFDAVGDDTIATSAPANPVTASPTTTTTTSPAPTPTTTASTTTTTRPAAIIVPRPPVTASAAPIVAAPTTVATTSDEVAFVPSAPVPVAAPAVPLPDTPESRRTISVLAAALGIVCLWVWRTWTARLGAADHPLAGAPVLSGSLGASRSLVEGTA